MPEREKVLIVVKSWVLKAENDLKAAVQTLKLGTDCPTDTVCFHAQQTVEKYLKALLVLKSVDFPKTHDMEELATLLPEGAALGLSLEEQRKLTAYATVTRYPGDYEPISLTEARKAVSLARRVRSAVRKLLPREVLRQGRK